MNKVGDNKFGEGVGFQKDISTCKANEEYTRDTYKPVRERRISNEKKGEG